jgi:hypothetical protein
MEEGFWPVEKAEHQGSSGRILPESGGNWNPALDSGIPKTGTTAGMCNLVPFNFVNVVEGVVIV